MAEKMNATCSICGKDYYKCLSCTDKISAEPFKKYTDTSEHYKIYQVIRGFNTGVYTKDEAKMRLQNIDLSDLEELRDNIKKILKDIMKEDKKVRVIEEPAPVVETQVETDVKQPLYMNRKKKHFEQNPVVADAEIVAE